MGTNAPGEIDLEVKDLEDRAARLKALLESRPAKRPLIIEFSGSPKAGKTRCISVLELFLKRNGLKVEVYTQRASISPIKSKGHLNFNVWVSCASLQGMLEFYGRLVEVHCRPHLARSKAVGQERTDAFHLASFALSERFGGLSQGAYDRRLKA